MANICSNTVVFEGNPEAIGQIQLLFHSMAELEKKERCGQLPDFIKDDNGGYFFDLYIQEMETGVFLYGTNWSPNIEVIKAIAERFSVDFTHEYEEASMGIFGRATYVAGVLTELDLDDTEFDQYDLDEETGMYLFEDREYESSYEILETLLNRKQQRLLTD